MILEHLRDALIERAQKRGPGKGNPTGSQLGACSAALQQLVWRDRIQPAPEAYQPRAIITFDMGDIIEEWLSAQIGERFPGLWGLRQETFHIPIPFPDDVPDLEVVSAFAAKVNERLPDNSRRLWGTVVEGFVPRKIEVGASGKLRVRGIGQGRDWRGLCLEPKTRTLWVPTQIDGALLHPQHGLTLVEVKSMTTWAFRRALVGEMDRRYQAQLFGMVRATGFQSAMWLAFRKEAGHMAEISFARDITGTQVTLTALNGQQDVYTVKDPKAFLVEPAGGGEAVTLDYLKDGQWWPAYVDAPWSAFNDDRLLEEIRQRIFRVILSNPDGPWYREAGPTFTCLHCQGTGRLPCSKCKGTGQTPSGRKACGVCGIGGSRYTGAVGFATCKKCTGTGHFEEVELPVVPCGYCAVSLACYGPAGVRREIDSRPHLLVTRAAYEASGLTFTAPGLPEEITPEADDDEEE